MLYIGQTSHPRSCSSRSFRTNDDSAFPSHRTHCLVIRIIGSWRASLVYANCRQFAALPPHDSAIHAQHGWRLPPWIRSHIGSQYARAAHLSIFPSAKWHRLQPAGLQPASSGGIQWAPFCGPSPPVSLSTLGYAADSSPVVVEQPIRFPPLDPAEYVPVLSSQPSAVAFCSGRAAALFQ